MRFRVAALTGIVLVTTLGGASLAAPPRLKPACNLAIDRSGDASWAAGKPESLDIVSADIASDGKDITVVWRLKGYSDPDPASPIGRKWVFSFVAPGAAKPLYVMAIIDPALFQPAVFEFGEITGVGASGSPTYGRGGSARGSVDNGRKEIRAHLPAADFNKFNAKLKSGVSLTSLTQRTYAMSNSLNSMHDSLVDSAQSTSKYALGYPSCVKVGL